MLPSGLTMFVGLVLVLFVLSAATLFVRDVSHFSMSLQSKDEHHKASGFHAIALWVLLGLPAVAFSMWFVIQIVLGHATVIYR